MPKQFPQDILLKESWEFNGAGGLNHNELDHLKKIFAANQRLGLISAIDYLHEEIINSPQRKFTAKLILKIVKQLQRYVAESLLVLDNEGRLGGGFSDQASLILLDPSIQGVEYCFPVGADAIQHNARILAREYSEEAAKQYLDYHQRISDYYSKETKRAGSNIDAYYALTKKSRTAVNEELGLLEYPGFKWFKKIALMLDEPEVTIKRVVGWAYKLADGLNRQEDPYELAAQALQFSALHPFMNGNGRTGRLLANAILLSRDVDAVDFNSEKNKYYAAIRQSATTIQPLVDLIKKGKPFAPQDFVNPKVAREEAMHFADATLVPTSGCYEVIATLDMQSQIGSYMAWIDREISQGGAFATPFMPPSGSVTAINAGFCEQKAISILGKNSDVAIFYWYQAAKFLTEENKIEGACHHYLTAAKECIKNKYFDGAYDMLCRSRTLAEQHQIKSIKNEVNSLLEKIKPVYEYRRKLLKIEEQALAQCSSAQQSSAQLVAQFSSIMQPEPQMDASSAGSSNQAQVAHVSTPQP